MLAQTQHAVEGNSCEVAGAFVDGNTVDDVAGDQIFQRPKEVLRGNAEHGGAHANAGVERHYFVARHFLAEPIDQVDFGADRPLRALGGFRDGLDDAFGRADLIGGLGYLEAAFRMHDHANAGMLAADTLDVLGREALVHRAVALPQNHARRADGFRRIAAEFLIRIPDDHL